MSITPSMYWRSAGACVDATADVAAGPAAADARALADTVRAAAESAEGGRAFAAIPFDRTAASAIITPRRDAPARMVPTGPVAFLDGGQSAPDAYRDGVRMLLERFADGTAEKVVLARYRDLTSPTPCDPIAIAEQLASLHPVAHAFALPVGPGRHFVGASPELLIAKDGAAIRSHPLAGSARRNCDPVLDRQTADALAGSEKDRREHAYVVEAICDVLAPLCRTLTAPDPGLLATDSMWHLGTEITAELRDPDVTATELAALLHPTPAVCGTPRDVAYDLIEAAEPFDREFFAGAVGWTDARGDGEWAVSIRCGEVTAHRIRAYAGAGIVAGSDPDAELAETTGKLSTFLSAARPADMVDQRS